MSSELPPSQAAQIRLVAVDLDGTLLNDSKKVSDQTVNALCGLPAMGVRVVIASARPPRSVRQIYRDLKLDTLQINYNGALIWDEANQRAVFHRPLAAAIVRDIVDFSRDLFEEVLVSCEVMDRWYTDRVDDPFTTETGRMFKPDVVAPVEEFCSIDATKLLLLAEPQIIARLEPELVERYSDRVTILQTDDYLLQIMHPRAGKAAALHMVAAHYGVPMEQVMAIGDAPNDVGMLQLAGVAIAMDNAHREVKKVADWIAPSNNDHGVHAALVRYGLCE
ncbi:MAG TPA: Cof-type HAD-IIB family hydrolase [Tepidisphaeraceae bacterium]|nr:Cof-type HAD-IIB family hydrolase [Tepidisphaeraceae bacterium]